MAGLTRGTPTRKIFTAQRLEKRRRFALHVSIEKAHGVFYGVLFVVVWAIGANIPNKKIVFTICATNNPEGVTPHGRTPHINRAFWHSPTF
jgi:hypothetical protein